MYKKYGVKALFGALTSCGALFLFFFPPSSASTAITAAAGACCKSPELLRTSARLASSAPTLPGAKTVFA